MTQTTTLRDKAVAHVMAILDSKQPMNSALLEDVMGYLLDHPEIDPDTARDMADKAVYYYLVETAKAYDAASLYNDVVSRA